MKELIKQQEKKLEGTIHAITAGLLLNGFIQGSENKKLDDHPLDFAKKEFDKVIAKIRKETAEKVCDEMIMENPNTDIRAWQAVDRYRTKLKEIKQQILKEIN